MVIDEEQHFGVGHKERLKEIALGSPCPDAVGDADPRTLQLALTGVREISIIATPPVDRLAVRTFVRPSIRSHRARGAAARTLSRRTSRSMSSARASRIWTRRRPSCARMVPGEIRDRARPDERDRTRRKMSAFYDGKYDILVSTNDRRIGPHIPPPIR